MTSSRAPSSISSALVLAVDGVGCSRRTGGAPTCLARPLPSGSFLLVSGGAADPFDHAQSVRVLETYPVLAIIALGWDAGGQGAIRRTTSEVQPGASQTFAISDWAHVCRTTSMRLAAEGARESAAWAETAATKTKPTKRDQDQLDACICLVSALHLAKGRDALFVGCCATGYIVVPDSEMLRSELERRCVALGRESASWVRVFRLPASSGAAARDA